MGSSRQPGSTNDNEGVLPSGGGLYVNSGHDLGASPEGFVVEVEPGVRVHFLDWGGPDPGRASVAPTTGALLIHGLAQTGWVWTPIARRLRRLTHVVAMDLRGHGLSDAPTHGYGLATLAADALAVAEGAGLLPGAGDGRARVVLAGHGFGALVAATLAAELGARCAGLVLVDGGWEDLAEATGMTPDEWLRGLDEPPEVLRSMQAYLADRAGFDPSSWDSDQEWAARTTVVATTAGRVVPVTRPHVVAGVVESMFGYQPLSALAAVTAPLSVLTAASELGGPRRASLAAVLDHLDRPDRQVTVADFPADGHNLMRYRPDEVTAAIGALLGQGGTIEL